MISSYETTLAIVETNIPRTFKRTPPLRQPSKVIRRTSNEYLPDLQLPTTHLQRGPSDLDDARAIVTTGPAIRRG
jgi:hypothetical protein